MVKPIAEVASKLGKGAHSKTPLQTGAGWMVLQLEDTRDTPPPPFDEIKNSIAQELQRESVARYVAELRKNGKLKLLEATRDRPRPRRPTPSSRRSRRRRRSRAPTR